MTPMAHRKDPIADHVELPLWIGQKVAVGRAEMKAELKGFLLGEDEGD
jgi:aromatic ring-cleaving dioxygenase